MRVRSHPRERRPAPNPNDPAAFTGDDTPPTTHESSGRHVHSIENWSSTMVYLATTLSMALPVFAFTAATGMKLSIPNILASSVPIPRVSVLL